MVGREGQPSVLCRKAHVARAQAPRQASRRGGAGYNWVRTFSVFEGTAVVAAEPDSAI
jgi:hypothetical protein